jgi:hypothetical protein
MSSGSRPRVKRETPSTEPRASNCHHRPVVATRYPNERTCSATTCRRVRVGRGPLLYRRVDDQKVSVGAWHGGSDLKPSIARQTRRADCGRYMARQPFVGAIAHCRCWRIYRCMGRPRFAEPLGRRGPHAMTDPTPFVRRIVRRKRPARTAVAQRCRRSGSIGPITARSRDGAAGCVVSLCGWSKRRRLHGAEGPGRPIRVRG